MRRRPIAMLMLIALTVVVAGQMAAHASGGDFSLDFVAAGPGTYNHDTGVGGAYGEKIISKTNGVVESLEGGDFSCGDRVVFFTHIAVDAGATGSQDVEIDFSFLMEPTGQPGAGFTDLLSAGVNAGDSANAGLDGDESVSIVSKTFDETPPPSQATMFATVSIAKLDAGEVFILRLVTLLGCDPGASPTGNLQAAIDEARVVSPAEDAISAGAQTIPFKKVEDIAQPGINVTKTCTPSASIGDTVTYTITVENTGNETLENIQVIDSLLGNLSGSFADTLAAGGSESHQFTHTVTASDPDPLPNTVTASADGATSGAHVSDTASCSSNIVHHPAIRVTKSCTEAAPVGGTVTYTITVYNDGDEPLTGITVSDSLLGDLSGSFADTLAAGASESHTFTRTVQADDPDPVVNTVTVAGTGADSQTRVEGTASCASDVIHQPGILVTKSCTPSAAIGETVTYTITVSNSGNEALEGVTVTDSILGDLSGSFADTLAVGASESHTFTHVITDADPDPLVNSVTASAEGADSGDSASWTAECSTDMTHTPAVSVTKSCTPVAGVGDTATYTISIANEGDEPLTGITVVDSLIGSLSGSFADTLAVGASESHTFTRAVSVSDPDPVVNTVTVAGTGADSHSAASATASCPTDVVHPAIGIVKTASPTVVSGEGVVTFTYVVTNTGDTPLLNISVDDDILGHIGDIAGPLAPGATATLFADQLVGPASPVRNVGTATGSDAYGHEVQASDDETIAVVLPEQFRRPLPETGGDLAPAVALAALLMAWGTGMRLIARRKRAS